MGEIFSSGSLYIRNDDGTYSPIGEVQEDCSGFMVASKYNFPDPAWLHHELNMTIIVTRKQQRKFGKQLKKSIARYQRIKRRFIRLEEKRRRNALKELHNVREI